MRVRGRNRQPDCAHRWQVGQVVAHETDRVEADAEFFAQLTHAGEFVLHADVGAHLQFLRAAARDGERFDFIYTLGLTDYFDDRAMSLLHQLMHRCLKPGGSILIANFLPDHMAAGWLDAVMDWQLIYRSETELHGFAAEIEMESRTWRDSTQSIAWCEMKAA
jgi:SAM-dependent methyltransferase